MPYKLTKSVQLERITTRPLALFITLYGHKVGSPIRYIKTKRSVLQTITWQFLPYLLSWASGTCVRKMLKSKRRNRFLAAPFGFRNRLSVPLQRIKETDKLNTASETRKPQKTTTQMTNNAIDAIVMLEYSIQRYQAMGNGTKCQDLRRQLNMLKKQQGQCARAWFLGRNSHTLRKKRHSLSFCFFVFRLHTPRCQKAKCRPPLLRRTAFSIQTAQNTNEKNQAVKLAGSCGMAPCWVQT